MLHVLTITEDFAKHSKAKMGNKKWHVDNSLLPLSSIYNNNYYSNDNDDDNNNNTFSLKCKCERHANTMCYKVSYYCNCLLLTVTWLLKLKNYSVYINDMP